MWKKVLLLSWALLILGNVLNQTAWGQEYPTRTIELLCPIAPGSSLDLSARLVADTARRYLGQSMVVVNKPGAGGSIVAADTISSKPDGYKLVQLSNFFFATTVKTQKIAFNPSHLIPMASFTELRIGMMVRGDSPWKTFNDFLDYAKKNPGKLKWSHYAPGMTNHMAGLLIFNKVGAKTIGIPYKGSPEAISALLGGHLDAYSGPYGAAMDQVKSGKCRYLIAYSDQRYSELPGVPCATELGFPEVANLKTILGVFAHKDTPQEIKKTLIDAFKKIYEDPDFKKGVENIGDEPRFGGPEFVMKAIKDGEEVGVPIVKELGLYIEGK